MFIEEGKCYRTRDGRKVGPAEFDIALNDPPWNVPWQEGPYYYSNDGKSCIGIVAHDIIEEWRDDVTLSSETIDRIAIDRIAIDSMKFHMNGDLEPLQREAFRIVLGYYGEEV